MAQAQAIENRINPTAAASLARCINRNHLYASDEETEAWLKTPVGARIQKLINELREKDKRRQT